MAFLVNNPQNICFGDVPHMHHLFREVCPAATNESFFRKNGNQSSSVNLIGNEDQANSMSKKKGKKQNES